MSDNHNNGAGTSSPSTDTRRLALEGIHYRRGDTHILNAIDWEVRAGEHWAVLGANGSGKTTLLQIATGYLPSSAGSVFMLDGYVREIVVPEARLRMGFVSGSLADHMLRWRDTTTGVEVVLSGRFASLGLFRNPTVEEEREAATLLQSLGAAHLAEKRYKTMSSGERQICMIARAYMARHELLIFDEPCAGLDMAMRERVLAAIDTGCRENPGVPHILVTHHTEEIVPGITHALLIREGCVVAKGAKDDVLTEANVSATFGIDVRLIAERGRLWSLPRMA